MIAPFGGIDARVTNNPISMAVPGPEHPLVLDMALSAVAESKVLQAHERGVNAPEGWLLDAAGRPSISPADYVEGGGTLAPLGGPAGGHKGYALIVLVEVIVGMLSGGPMCGPKERRFSNGFVLLAVDPARDGARAADVLRDLVPRLDGPYDVGCVYVGVNDTRALDWDPDRFAEDFDAILAGAGERAARAVHHRGIELDLAVLGQHRPAAGVEQLAVLEHDDRLDDGVERAPSVAHRAPRGVNGVREGLA
jgi:hypothetical protein